MISKLGQTCAITLIVLMTMFCDFAQAEDWNFIQKQASDMVGVRNVRQESSGKFAGYYNADVLHGFLPDGREDERGRMIGSRVRTIFFNCNSPYIRVFIDTIYDKQFKPIETYSADKLTLEGSRLINKNDNRDIDLAVGTICGEKTNVGGKVALFCSLENNWGDSTLEVDYGAGTVNGVPAKVSDYMIEFRSGKFLTVINRTSGSMNVSVLDDNFVMHGRCSPQNQKKF